MKKYLPFIFIASCFLLLKIMNLGIRLSDTNIYFYTGHLLLQGKVLYKDIFFTNFPLLPYISSLYYILTFKQLSLFYFTAVIEATATGFLIYHIILKRAKSQLVAGFCSGLYLFSFMILSTTDHQTGVFLASLFAVLSYYFYLEKKWLWTGVFIALALLTKAYFIPIFATYIVLLFFDRSGEVGETKQHFLQKFLTILRSARTIRLITGFLLTVGIVLLPTLLFARADFIRDVFAYSLTRSEGIPKGRILWFFITHDLLIFTSFSYALVMIRKYRFFGMLSIFSIIFIIFYKDIYYLYLNFLFPFYCLAFAKLYQDIQKHIQMQKMVIPTIIGIFLLANLLIYMNGYRNLQKLDNIDILVSAINQVNPPYLYGSNGLTPALAYLTDTPLLNKTVDTNPNLFRKGFLHAEKLTSEALQKNALFVTEGVSLPEMGVEQPVTDEVIDVKQLMKKKCSLIQTIPMKSEGYQNRINLISCQ